MASHSYFQKTVTLVDWWLTKPQTETIGVAGLTYHEGGAARSFSSAPIQKIHDLFQLETVDGVCVMLQALINKDRTLKNRFPPEVFDHFIMGFPHNWKEFATSCSKSDSDAAKCVTTVPEDVNKGDGHGDLLGNPQNYDDSYTVHMGVNDCEDIIMLSDKTPITPLNPPSVEIPQEHIIEAGNEVTCEKSPVTQSFTRKNIKSSRKKKEKVVNVSKKEALMTHSKSKTKVLAKMASPKSTSSRGKKGSEGSAIILPLESFSGKKSRSGRIVLPPLEFWRNQKVVYDEDKEMVGVQEPN